MNFSYETYFPGQKRNDEILVKLGHCRCGIIKPGSESADWRFLGDKDLSDVLHVPRLDCYWLMSEDLDVLKIEVEELVISKLKEVRQEIDKLLSEK